PSAFSTAASASYGDPTCAILPSLPMTTVVGQPETGYAPMVFFSGSEPTGIVYAFCVRNGCITAAVSYEIASTVRPRSVYRSCSFWTPGIARTHGPHQVPQNSIITTRPFRDARVGASPFQLSQAAAWIGGASLPTAGCWAEQWTAVVSSTASADNR